MLGLLEIFGLGNWVRALVEAYGAGEIELPKPNNNQGLRYAPHFEPNSCSDTSKSRPYNVESLTGFLGWSDARESLTEHTAATRLRSSSPSTSLADR
jgi:hypothetical protein